MITSEQLAMVAGLLVSVGAFYIPRLGPWYNAQDGQVKAQLMGAAIVLVGCGSFVLAIFCVGPLCLPPPIDWGNALWHLGLTIVSALISNQSLFKIVKAARGE